MTSCKDLEHPGRRLTARNLANVCAVEQVLEVDQHATIRQMATEVQVSTGSVHNILTKDLELKKKAPKFVPRILTQEQMDLRVRLCRQNLKETQDPLFLWTLVTGDESWFSVLEPEQKQQSLQWVDKKATRSKKALRARQAKKTMMEVFFDDQGVVHLKFLPPKMTVTAKVYIGILSCLCEANRRKRPAIWKDNSYRLLHNNAPGHTATPTFAAMVETSMKIVDHPPYSPDLAPADFWFFPYLKSQIRCCIFATVAELQDHLMTVISAMPKSVFHKCIHETLPNRWKKCIAVQGAYFEGDDIALLDDSQLLESSSESGDMSDESD